MKILAVICLVAVSIPVPVVPDSRTLEEARQIGQGTARWFFLFSTATAKYTIRHDGFGEMASHGKRKEVFQLNFSPPSRLERVYFGEYDGDLLLLYTLTSGRTAASSLLRMNQQTRKIRWASRIEVDDIESCTVAGAELHCGPPDNLTKIDLKTGALS